MNTVFKNSFYFIIIFSLSAIFVLKIFPYYFEKRSNIESLNGVQDIFGIINDSSLVYGIDSLEKYFSSKIMEHHPNGCPKTPRTVQLGLCCNGLYDVTQQAALRFGLTPHHYPAHISYVYESGKVKLIYDFYYGFILIFKNNKKYIVDLHRQSSYQGFYIKKTRLILELSDRLFRYYRLGY